MYPYGFGFGGLGGPFVGGFGSPFGFGFNGLAFPTPYVRRSFFPGPFLGGYLAPYGPYLAASGWGRGCRC
jgi:hypothetical protein